MRALIFVFLLSTVTAWSLSNKCDSLQKTGICLFANLLKSYVAPNYKNLIHQCCAEDECFAKVYAKTKDGKEVVKIPGSYLEYVDFNACDIAGEGICPKCCLVTGEWTQWSEFSGCSATCDGGKKIRVRECKLPASSSGGGVPTCEGDAVETMSCATTPCLETKCNEAGYEYDATAKVCIKIFDDVKLNYFGTIKKCFNEGGRLYIADTRDKIDFLKHLIDTNQLTDDAYYLGGFDCNGKNEFTWFDGSDVDFDGVVPAPNKDCVQYSRLADKLKDTKCTALKAYVCELVH